MNYFVSTHNLSPDTCHCKLIFTYRFLQNKFLISFYHKVFLSILTAFPPVTNHAVYHSTSSISIQPVEKITYGDNSTKRYRNILRHELELKWIELLQTPHPLGFNDNIYHEGNISRLPDFDVFFSFRYT